MRESQSPATVILAVIFGALTGMIALILLAWQTGFLDWDDRGLARTASLSATPGMDMLNAYQCRKEETKHIILGGIEDNFSRENEEPVSESIAQKLMAEKHGKLGAVEVTRSYDEDGVDNILLDEFSFPAKTVHGIMAIHFRELSTLQNDSLTIGNILSEYEFSHLHATAISQIDQSDIWLKTKNVFYAKLSDLHFSDRYSPNGEILPQHFESVLKLIQGGKKTTPIQLYVGDDTMVDFIGFAICKAPLQRRGTSFRVRAFDLPSEFIGLACTDDTGKAQCNPYKGDTICSEKLPLTCFADRREPLPQFLKDNILSVIWSGGEVRFAEPVAGNSFVTEDDVHEFCRAEFGAEWRAATIHEGHLASAFIAKGATPTTAKVWIDTKTQPYGNCWKLRPDYDEIEKTGGAND